MRRAHIRKIAGTALAGILVLIPTAAHAAAPTREPLPAEGFVLTDHCTFDIQIDIVQNKEIATTFYDSNGDVTRQLVTGALKVRLTNLSEPSNSVVLSISGPGTYVDLADGTTRLTGTGSWLQFGITNMPGELLLMNGPFTALLTDEGFFLTDLPNNVEDGCQLLV
jgi:hypothetical protein